jgi:hypothetical protein
MYIVLGVELVAVVVAFLLLKRNLIRVAFGLLWSNLIRTSAPPARTWPVRRTNALS